MSTSNGMFNFDDLMPIEIPFSLKDAKGHKVDYVLKEPTGDAACKYRNSILRSSTIGSDGKPTSFGNLADSEPELVSMCVFRIDEAGNHKPVRLDEVRSWPSRIVSSLYKKAKDIGKLEESDETPEELEAEAKNLTERATRLRASAKNSLSATTAGSE